MRSLRSVYPVIESTAIFLVCMMRLTKGVSVKKLHGLQITRWLTLASNDNALLFWILSTVQKGTLTLGISHIIVDIPEKMEVDYI